MANWQDITDDREKYQAYLCSREWAELRESVRARSGGKCERCQFNNMDAVHHLTYARKYNESLDDLQAICNPCHEFTHGKSKVDPIVEASEIVGARLDVICLLLFRNDLIDWFADLSGTLATDGPGGYCGPLYTVLRHGGDAVSIAEHYSQKGECEFQSLASFLHDEISKRIGYRLCIDGESEASLAISIYSAASSYFRRNA